MEAHRVRHDETKAFGIPKEWKDELYQAEMTKILLAKQLERGIKSSTNLANKTRDKFMTTANSYFGVNYQKSFKKATDDMKSQHTKKPSLVNLHECSSSGARNLKEWAKQGKFDVYQPKYFTVLPEQEMHLRPQTAVLKVSEGRKILNEDETYNALAKKAAEDQAVIKQRALVWARQSKEQEIVYAPAGWLTIEVQEHVEEETANKGSTTYSLRVGWLVKDDDEALTH